MRLKFQIGFSLTVLVSGMVLAPRNAQAVIIETFSDVEFQDNDGDGVFENIDTTDATLGTRSFPGFAGAPTNTSVMFFDVTPIAGVALDSAELALQLQGFTSSTQAIDIGGYIDDGAITPLDRIIPTVTLGTFTPGNFNLGTIFVPLDEDVLETLAVGGGPIGLRFNATGIANFQVASREGTTLAPTLSVVPTAVPEPTSLALLTALATLTVARHHRRRQRTTP